MDKDRKNPKDASKAFEGIIKASVNNIEKPKTLSRKEAELQSDTYQSMIGNKYYFPGNQEAIAVKVGVTEVDKEQYQVLVIGKSNTGFISALIIDRILKEVK